MVPLWARLALVAMFYLGGKTPGGKHVYGGTACSLTLIWIMDI